MLNLSAFLAECLQTLPDNLKHLKADIGAHFELKLAEELRKKNILMREDFDILNKVVLKLEQRVTELESQLDRDNK